MFHPGEPVPAAELSVNAPHEDDVTLFQAEIELESGSTREFELGRTEFYCQ